MPTPVERITARLTRDGALYRCPAHDDSRGSLSVSDGRTGGAVLYCHAGCATRDVLAAIGLTERDLFATNANGARNGTALAISGSRGARLVARYDYTNEHGATLYRVNRTDPKGFWQERADGVRSLAGVPRVLYNLPDTIEAVGLGKDIHLTEGEKDADTLAALGYAATTVAGGANAELTPELAETLRGASVVIHADNDAPGRKCAETRAAALAGVAAAVRIVQYPELPPHGDVFDAVAAGATAEDILARAAAAPLWAPRATASDGPKVWALAELLNDPELLRPPPAIIANVAYAGRLTLFAAREKAGKSTFIGAAAAAVSRGGPFLGVPTVAEA